MKIREFKESFGMDPQSFYHFRLVMWQGCAQGLIFYFKFRSNQAFLTCREKIIFDRGDDLKRKIFFKIKP